MEPGVTYSPSAPSEPKKSPPLSPKLVMGVVAGLILLVIFGAYGIRYFKKPNPVVETQVLATPTTGTYFIQTTPTPIEKNPGWKTYVDPTNVFSVQYPPEYNLSKYSESSFNGIQLDYLKPASSASASAQITLKLIYLEHSAKTAKQFAQDQVALEKNATLDGLTVNIKGEWGRGKIIFMEQDGTVYRLSSVIAAPLNFIPTYEGIVNKIFASFTILNPDDRGK